MFKNLVKYPLYRISDTGEVFSVIYGKPCKPFVRGKKLIVQLVNEQGIRQAVSLLELVQEAFFELHHYQGLTTHYLDNNPYNLAVSNLYFKAEEYDPDFTPRGARMGIEDLETVDNGMFTVFDIALTRELTFPRMDELLLALQAGKTALKRIITINSKAVNIDGLLPTVDLTGKQWFVMFTKDYKRLIRSVESGQGHRGEYDDEPDLEIM